MLAAFFGALPKLLFSEWLRFGFSACFAFFGLLASLLSSSFALCLFAGGAFCLFFFQPGRGHSAAFTQYTQVEEQPEDCRFGGERHLCFDFLVPDETGDEDYDSEDECYYERGEPGPHDFAETQDNSADDGDNE